MKRSVIHGRAPAAVVLAAGLHLNCGDELPDGQERAPRPAHAASTPARGAQTTGISTLQVVGFNVEAGRYPESDLDRIREQVASYGNIDIWGFSEMTESEWPAGLTAAAEAGHDGGDEFAYRLGTFDEDRLAIVFNRSRFEQIGEDIELDAFAYSGRAPFAVHLQERETAVEFLFMVNHLHRSASDLRHRQARDLNEWVVQQELPVIAVGDYNFDWDLPDGASRDAGFDELVKDDAWSWVRPAVLVKTQCSPDYDSILDFVWVGSAAKDWSATSEILERDTSYCEAEIRNPARAADHRPVAATFALPHR